MRDTITVVISSGVSQGFIAVLYLLAARHVGPSAFGAALAFIGVGNFLASLVDFGQNSMILREMAASKISSQQIFHQVFTKSVAVTLVAVFFGFIVYIDSSNGVLAVALAIYVVLLSLEMTAQSILRWTGGVKKFSLTIICDKAASLLSFIIVLTADYKSEIWIPFALTVGSLVGLLVAIILHPGRFRLKAQKFSAGQAFRYIASARSFGWFGFAVALQGLDIFVLRIVAGSEAAGSYAAVSRWIMPLTLIAGAYSTATYPRFASAKDNTSARALLQTGKKLWVGSWLVIGAIIVAAPTLVEVLLGTEYSNSVLVLRILCFAMFLSVLNQPVAVFLQARGSEKQVANSIGIGVAFQLTFTFVLGHYLGAVGASYAWLIQQSISFILLASLLHKLK